MIWAYKLFDKRSIPQKIKKSTYKPIIPHFAYYSSVHSLYTVWWTFPIAEILTAIVSAFFLREAVKFINNK